MLEDDYEDMKKRIEEDEDRLKKLGGVGSLLDKIDFSKGIFLLK